jgi:hypothetical protein
MILPPRPRPRRCGLVGEAPADGARLAVLPEALVRLYPLERMTKSVRDSALGCALGAVNGERH